MAALGRGRRVLVDVAKPTPAEQQARLGRGAGPTRRRRPGPRCAGQFDLEPADDPTQVVAARADRGRRRPPAAPTRSGRPACAATGRALDLLAQRIEPKATWDDLVLPRAEPTLLRQIAAQVRHRGARSTTSGASRRRMNRGLGISALFAGESGTGKTMAAEVIADDLRLDLYRIDLSAVVSKYIGETEKNLRRLFDAAEEGGAILFFDEADALFGKRSEVKDSHDRYANIEINYLLQRMEAYRGLAILATNMKSALDPAFMRRLRFIVELPVSRRRPSGRRSGSRSFPPGRRRARPRLRPAGAARPHRRQHPQHRAERRLPGGPRRHAGDDAARAGAARTEFRKLERPVNEADFRLLEAKGVAA